MTVAGRSRSGEGGKELNYTDSRIQSDVEELIAKSNQNKFQLNESKCKELRISFAKSAADFAPIVINGKAIEVVSTVKLLGLNISSDLRWNCHVAEISKKVASRLYFLKQLKRANIPAKDLLIFYLTCIRPVTEYACPVFHNALPAYLSAELEQLQKRAMRIIFPFVPRRVCKGNDPLFPSSRASPLCVVWTSLVCRFLGGEQDMRHQTGPWNNT